jgi:hypothetical protein
VIMMDSCFHPFVRRANICKDPKRFHSGICHLCQCLHHVSIDPFFSYLYIRFNNIINASIDGGLHSYWWRILAPGGLKGYHVSWLLESYLSHLLATSLFPGHWVHYVLTHPLISLLLHLLLGYHRSQLPSPSGLGDEPLLAVGARQLLPPPSLVWWQFLIPVAVLLPVPLVSRIKL